MNAKTIRHISGAILTMLVSLFTYAFLVLLFTGCATKTEYIERVKTVEVKVPVQCEVPTPTLKALSENELENRVNTFIYVEELELSLGACKGELNGK